MTVEELPLADRIDELLDERVLVDEQELIAFVNALIAALAECRQQL